MKRVLLIPLFILNAFVIKADNIHLVSGNFTTLQTAVNNAETYIAGLDLSLYPTSALLEYRDAINMAKNLILQGTANQTTINSYKTNLTTAKTKFNATKGKVLDTSNVVGAYNSNRGFKHPGGLHTQADFDRIKLKRSSC